MSWDVVRRLAAHLGSETGDLSSGHERWGVYQHAVDTPETWPDLLAALKSEPDQPVASAVVVQLLERVPSEMRGGVVGVLTEGKSRDFAEARSRELGILESLAARRSGADPAQLGSWSTWLQLRAASEATDEAVLAELARSGRTRRVRSVASRRSSGQEP
jgi:hypothetical protein